MRNGSGVDSPINPRERWWMERPRRIQFLSVVFARAQYIFEGRFLEHLHVLLRQLRRQPTDEDAPVFLQCQGSSASWRILQEFWIQNEHVSETAEVTKEP